MDDSGAPEIWCVVAYPVMDGEVLLDLIPSKVNVVTLEAAEQFHRLGWVVMTDYESKQAYFDWQRTRHRWSRW